MAPTIDLISQIQSPIMEPSMEKIRYAKFCACFRKHNGCHFITLAYNTDWHAARTNKSDEQSNSRGRSEEASNQPHLKTPLLERQKSFPTNTTRIESSSSMPSSQHLAITYIPPLSKPMSQTWPLLSHNGNTSRLGRRIHQSKSSFVEESYSSAQLENVCASM